ncbi:glutathione S-transferase [Pseudomonas asplenii]|uniref:Glutathione S-transferase n=1 Tax=Pseudomonas asplenii TaxID=53407 RepID=A0A0N0E614_9PSED|nr:glutathione transferase GstA [Pseudomonas fuscovaginae]KPA93111.1 glutathione S-transferase [Pseudomonas fuscovaginae]
MKLYYAPETCSLAPHIVLRELGLPFERVRVDNRSKLTEHGDDFRRINPKGYVAALQLDNGEVLTEGAAILQFLADLRPEAGLAPPHGSWQRVRLQEWLNFLGSEIHGTMGPLFNVTIPEEVKAIFRTRLFQRFDLLENTLAKQDYLLEGDFSVADAYLFTVMRWNRFFAIDLAPWPALVRFMTRIGERPNVKLALEVESAP